jgi:hypothetical protein
VSFVSRKHWHGLPLQRWVFLFFEGSDAFLGRPGYGYLVGRCSIELGIESREFADLDRMLKGVQWLSRTLGISEVISHLMRCYGSRYPCRYLGPIIVNPNEWS